MATTIWKTVLAPTEVQTIEVPAGAEMLCAREQLEAICVWFKCDPEQAKEKRTIRICGTGHDAPTFGNAWRFLGTTFLEGGQLVFHVFERAQ